MSETEDEDLHRILREQGLEFAEQTYTSIFANEIDQVLDALGHREALVTDESRMYDFEEDDFEQLLVKVRNELDVEVAADDLIYEVARRIYNKRNK